MDPREKEHNAGETTNQPITITDDRHINSMDVIEGDVHFEPEDPRGVCYPDELNRSRNQ